MASHSELSFSDSLRSDRRQQFYEQHKTCAIAMILAVFLLPFGGVYVQGLLGAICGVVLSIIAYYVAPFVVLKLEED